VRRSKGYRSRTRTLFRKKPREKGKVGLSRLLRTYNPGDKVMIRIDSSVHKGMPHRRYHGRIGVIKAKRGRSYIIEVDVGKQTRTVIARPEHIESS
jgi:large subunit ribosomal protein L21e